MKKISIIVPVYNTSQYLNKCFDSILLQNYKNIELIVINDGSTDNSLSIINEYKKKDNRIIVIDKENSGQADCRNIGIDTATGDYLMFVDSDDYLESNAFDILINRIEDKDCDILCFDFYTIINNEKKYEKSLINYTEDIKRNYYLSPPSPCNKIFKTKILNDNNFKFLVGYIYEDLATIPLTAFYTDKIDYINVPLYNYVIRKGSTMRQKEYNSKLENIYYAMDYLYDNTKRLNNEYDKELEYMFIEHLLHASTLRFLEFKNTDNYIEKNALILLDKFPNWEENIYYKKQTIKYKIMCKLVVMKKFKILRRIFGEKI